MLTLIQPVTAYTLQELKDLAGDHGRAYDSALENILAWLNQDTYWTEQIMDNLQSYLDQETRIRGKVERWHYNPLDVVFSGSIHLDDFMITQRLHGANGSLSYWTKATDLFESAYSFHSEKSRYQHLDFADDFVEKWISTVELYTEWERTHPLRYEKICEQIHRVGRALDSYIDAAHSKLLSLIDGEFKYHNSSEYALAEAEIHNFLFDVHGSLLRI